jgi:acetyltransferase-like isoleucine patch superfamily enzyme
MSVLEKLTLERLLGIPASWLFRIRVGHIGKGSFISPFVQGIGLDCVRIGQGSRINRHTRILALKAYRGQAFSPKLTIGDDTNIGFGCTLSCVNEVTIGDHVTVSDNVYIADSKHGHAAPGQGALRQPLVPGKIEIGDGAWIGYGAFIAGSISIGEHSIVGANSVVTHDVPPYTFVGGVPAHPLQSFDLDSNAWIAMTDIETK